MSVLVTYASSQSSTAEIADQIADRLLKSGVATVVRPVNQVASLQLHRAVILGSTLHDREWLPEATEFLRRFSGELAKLPIWLFSTGSLNQPNQPFGRKIAAVVDRSRHQSAGVSSARDATNVRGHRHFAGVFEQGGWSVLADLFSKVCGGSRADRRDWRNVNEWAAGIARELQSSDRIKERRRLHLSVRGRP